MRIAIDISQIVYGTGVSVYTKELVRNLLKLDQKNEYILFGSSLRRRSEIKAFFHILQGSTFQGRVFSVPPAFSELLWNKLRFPKVETLVGEIDVFHSSDWTQPPTRAKKVTTIHDLSPIKYPQWTHPRITAVHKRRLEIVKKEVDQIIAPSQTTKADLIEMGFTKEKITVIPEAVSENFKRSKTYQIERTKKHFGIKDKYIFTVGLGGRKNTEKLIKAFRNTVLDFNVSLVIAGGGEIKDAWRQDGVKFLGFVEDKYLADLYSGAEVFVYPSLYEGFGLPILESFSCSTPVVTSNLGSMKEVSGGAAVLVDPNNEISISNGIKESQEKAKELILLGKRRVKDFSWELAARKTMEVYNTLS